MKLNHTVFVDFCEKNLQNATFKNGKHFHTRCPICGDSQKSKYKKRFHVDWNNGQPFYNCFNCGDSGSFIKLYSFIKGVTAETAKNDLYEYNSDTIRSILKPKKIEVVKDQYKPIDFFKELKPIIITEDENDDSTVYKKAQKYIKDFRERRQIDKNISLFYAYKGQFRNRIIIPVFHNEKMVYFQARRVHPNQQPKYLNPGVKKDNIILNIENMNPDDPIIINEGLLDAYTIGKQATSILGATLHDNFISVLRKRVNDKIILVLDNYLVDERAKKELLNILKDAPFRDQLYYFNWNCIGTKYKDINEFYINNNISKIDLYRKIIENSYSRVSIAVKIKINGV